MRIPFIFLFLVIVQFVNGQTSMQEEILGKWKLVKKTATAQKQSNSDSIATAPTSYTFFKKDVLLDFKANESLGFEIEDEAIILFVSYSCKDSLLTIADYKFHILKLDQKELFFKAQKDSVHATYQYKRM